MTAGANGWAWATCRNQMQASAGAAVRLLGESLGAIHRGDLVFAGRALNLANAHLSGALDLAGYLEHFAALHERDAALAPLTDCRAGALSYLHDLQCEALRLSDAFEKVAIECTDANGFPFAARLGCYSIAADLNRVSEAVAGLVPAFVGKRADA